MFINAALQQETGFSASSKDNSGPQEVQQILVAGEVNVSGTGRGRAKLIWGEIPLKTGLA
jgi:hypothetical protein